MSSLPNHTTITIAGTVGIGKSTLTKALANKLNFKTSFENVDHNPYLEKFYSDFERWSFHLQIFFLAERFKEQKRIFEYGGGFVQDRSIYEDVDIFAKMHYDGGTMTAEDYSTYYNLYEAMVLSPYFPKPDVLLYLDASLEDVLNRLVERGRQMEIETDKSYWQALHNRYTEWIEHFTEVPVVRININDYDVDDEESLDQIIEKIAHVLSVRSKHTLSSN
ncbi:deoxynucleoside kinase [Abyssicoccus albus]|uniref:Deoxyadenosine/deoxycytidine kinase n=1 Tax=Abyssicoccus albus TaxID=1817405 RepID=A0A3N5BAP6_9BACL|nr:deoxynucleoside kinase [Abyssicoccus albus]RPF54846.1 deoxyadenosine/deoxycytidine kinase [Abyssicoccus albus]